MKSLVSKIKQIAKPKEQTIDNEQNKHAEDKPVNLSARLISLDAFRGLTILGMLLVNNVALGTATPDQFVHAPWNGGVRFADMVFPWFLFIVGVAIPYAVASYKKKSLSIWRYYLKAFGRMLTLVLLGCLIDSSIAKAPVFGLGVLQLIGLAYFVAIIIYNLPVYYRLVFAAALLISYWAIIRFVSIPGVGTGVFTESQNIIKYINEMYLGRYHLIGLISVVPTSALVLIGTVVGDVLRREIDNQNRKTIYLIAGGAVLAALGWLWSLDLPFNKPVWTSSYILYTGGLASIVLGIMYILIDIKGWQRWAFPFVVFGANAIAAYVVPIIIKIHIFQEWQWEMPDGSSLPLQQTFLHSLIVQYGQVAGGWIYTISYILFWWLILLQLYRKQIFLRV